LIEVEEGGEYLGDGFIRVVVGCSTNIFGVAVFLSQIKKLDAFIPLKSIK